MKILREPLLHFVVLGGVLFGLYSLAGEGDGAAPGEIVVTAGQVASLQESFERAWRRPPSADETESLIKEHIRDEVFYREALAMGLDEDDVVIRRRMRQKLEFIAGEIADAEPTDAELAAYVAEHPQRFLSEPQYSFRHIYFRTDGGKRPLEADLQRLLADLRSRGAAADTAELGDPFMPGDAFEGLAQSDVKRIFGPAFADELAELPVGTWEGPVASGYGLHLAHLGERRGATTPPFAVIRDLARREWLNERRVEANEALFERLRSRYAITIKPTGQDRLATAAQ